MEQETKKIVYEKHYKLFTFISISLLILASIYLLFNYMVTGEFFKKDISLTGGTTLTLYGNYEKAKIEPIVKKYADSYIIKYTRDIYSNKIVATIIEAKINEEQAKNIVNELKLNESDYSIELTSPALGKNFFRQLITAIIIAFVFMSIAVFIIFRTFVPSIAVILAALTDIIATLAIVDLLGISISTAGIAAFLMLLGYSVDTDIMLTTKVIKRREAPLPIRLKSALKTGLTMTSTSLIAMFIAFLFSTSGILKQIFLILSIGLAVDIFATWVGNISIITWYVKKKYKE